MAKVTYKRVETNSEALALPIIDGQLIYSKQGRTYMDYGTTRVAINGTVEDAMSSSSTNPVENRVIKSYVDTNIANVQATIYNGTVLWQNPNPTSSFTAKDITLSSSDYDILEIYYYNYGALRGCSVAKSIKGENISLTATFDDGNHGYIGTRRINYVNDTKLHAYDSKSIVRAGSYEYGTYNDWNIPLYIIGYKTNMTL